MGLGFPRSREESGNTNRFGEPSKCGIPFGLPQNKPRKWSRLMLLTEKQAFLALACGEPPTPQRKYPATPASRYPAPSGAARSATAYLSASRNCIPAPLKNGPNRRGHPCNESRCLGTRLDRYRMLSSKDELCSMRKERTPSMGHHKAHHVFNGRACRIDRGDCSRAGCWGENAFLETLQASFMSMDGGSYDMSSRPPKKP